MSTNNQFDEIIDFKQFIFKIINNWYLFFISVSLAFVIAYTYNRYAKELYHVQTSILIKEDNSAAADLLFEKSMKTNPISMENKELVLKSYPLVYSVLEELKFDIAYYIIGNIKVSETFFAPVRIECSDISKIVGKNITIENIDDKKFALIYDDKKRKIYQFGEDIFFYNTNIKVFKDLRYSANHIDKSSTLIKFKDLKVLAQTYQKKILVSIEDRESTVINISILEEDQNKGVVFLNKLTENYIYNDINEKNIASKNTVSFITFQLKEMSDSLSRIEQKMQEYKDNNKIINLGLEAQSIYSNIINIETKLAESKSLKNYYTYLEKCIEDNTSLLGLSVPTSFGINDAILNDLINQLIELQINKNILINGGQFKNPSIAQYNRQIKQLILNLKEAINASNSSNNLIIKDFEQRVSKMEASLSVIPKIERELLSIKRLQSISENLYIFLLKKRAEAEITSYSNVSDTKVLEPAMFFVKQPVAPDKSRNYLFAFLIGIALPVLYLLFKEIFNDKIVSRFDLEKCTSIPILGMIGANDSSHNLLSMHSPKSVVFEGFRALRSNLNFSNISNDKKVYLVTSSISGEGKTYIAENLAIVFAKSGKKTLVIGADLRRPQLYTDFSLNNDIGMTSHILGDKLLNDVIVKSNIENLDILISGPVPANPSDALLNEKFKKMLALLKEQYDIIILDTPPLGLVADALTLMKYSDINIYVVRQNYTQKGILAYVNDLFLKSRVGDIQLVFNDVKEGSGAYGYGYSYGYGYGYGYGSKNRYGYVEGSEYFNENNN